MSFQLKKRFGQNFLKNPVIINKIISSISNNIQEIFEIGPGSGALTQVMLARGLKIKAIEIDSDCIALLKKFDNNNLEIIHQDVLQYRFPAHAHIIGNLPYNIGTKIIENLVYNSVETGIFMLQREVAQRMMQNCRLGIFVQAVYDIQKIVDAKPDDFRPRPKVESQVIKLIRHNRLPTLDLKKLDQITKIIFSQPRKQLNFLKQFPEILDKLRAKNINLEQRANQLPKQVFYELV